MNAFVQMRKTIGNHQQLLQLSSDFTNRKLETNEKFENIFKALEGAEIKDEDNSILKKNEEKKRESCCLLLSAFSIS